MGEATAREKAFRALRPFHGPAYFAVVPRRPLAAPHHNVFDNGPVPSRMGFWNKIFGGSGGTGRVDYYEEGLDLLSEGKYHEALTSFRLALKESPGDTVVLQQIAIAYTRIGMTEEAIKTYRHVLQKEPNASGAHYGLAYLLLRGGLEDEARSHLRAFLQHAPNGSEAGEHIAHARATLESLEGGHGGAAGAHPGPQSGY